MTNNIYDVIIVGAGPGGIYAAYELMTNNPDLKIAIFEAGNSLEKRKCPIDGNKVKSCINCKSCAIMKGLVVQVLSLMENLILQMTSAELFMSMLEKKRQLN